MKILRRAVLSNRVAWAGLATLLLGLAVTYVGYGRWWGLAHASDVRLAVTTHLLATPAYRQYAREIRQIHGVLPEIAIVPDAAAEERDAAKAINQSRGNIRDGHYRVSLVARVELAHQLFARPIKVADYVGQSAIDVKNGQVSTPTFKFRGLDVALLAHAKFVSILAATDAKSLGAKSLYVRLELLDRRACDYKTARHIEQVFGNFTGWSEFAARRLFHVGLLLALRESGDFYYGGNFTLTPESSRYLGFPQALRMGDEDASRVCILITAVNRYGEPADETQTIAALEQVSREPIVMNEVLQVEASELDVDTVNSLLAGDLPRWVTDLMSVALLILLLFALRFVLGILVQIKTLITSPTRCVIQTESESGVKTDA